MGSKELLLDEGAGGDGDDGAAGGQKPQTESLGFLVKSKGAAGVWCLQADTWCLQEWTFP